MVGRLCLRRCEEELPANELACRQMRAVPRADIDYESGHGDHFGGRRGKGLTLRPKHRPCWHFNLALVLPTHKERAEKTREGLTIQLDCP